MATEARGGLRLSYRETCSLERTQLDLLYCLHACCDGKGATIGCGARAASPALRDSLRLLRDAWPEPASLRHRYRQVRRRYPWGQG
ncbi:hypothetical protein KGM_215236 [Danaus plexippus plexippus]|uniref:Uncharacterized protein n=1 Tax=Danaus plexippus plexippus TaxID=278856 RepID=A0A212FBT3_DANPL|nr:hypothetical protein KGM_215236 [Danaus plexippus plexippus]